MAERTNEELYEWEKLVASLEPTDSELADILDGLFIAGKDVRLAVGRAAARLRALDGERIEGWVFIEGMDSDHQDCINVYPTHEGEPDNHDGFATLILHKEPEQ